MTPLDPVYLAIFDWITAQRAGVDVGSDFNSLMTSEKLLHTDLHMPIWGCIRWGAEQRGSAPAKHLNPLLTRSHWAPAKREVLQCDLHCELHSDLWLELAWEWGKVIQTGCLFHIGMGYSQRFAQSDWVTQSQRLPGEAHLSSLPCIGCVWRDQACDEQVKLYEYSQKCHANCIFLICSSSWTLGNFLKCSKAFQHFWKCCHFT